MHTEKFLNSSKILLLSFLIAAAIVIFPAKSIASSFSEQYQKLNDNVSFVQTNNNIPGEGNFFMRRIIADVDYTYWTSFRIPGDFGTLSYFDSNKQLVQVPMKNGILPQRGLMFLSTDSYNYIIGQPYTYRNLGYGTYESVSNQPVNLRKDSDGWIVSFSYKLAPGVHGVLWGIGSQNELIDLSAANQLKIWSNYDVTNDARILYDGYHYKSPTSYYPSTGKSYWKIPSDYMTNSLVRTGGSLASDIMGQSMLRIAHRNINEEGFLPTLPRSNWLFKDYGMGDAFFDTRFNGDTLETNIVAYKKYGDEIYRDVARRLAGYYLDHGRNNHFVVKSPSVGEGWLVEDYYHPLGRKNHSSLNHQLQAIHAFLLLYEVDQNPEYLDFADRMLKGIKITRDKWIMRNGNLEYAYMPNGSMGLVDYPYLTYNDLVIVQKDLERIKGQRDPDLDVLINTKKIWMDSNNITGYRK